MTLKKGQILTFSHFFLKVGLACRKIEASQGFWYQGVDANMLFQNSPPLICITIDVPVIAHFPKFSALSFITFWLSFAVPLLSFHYLIVVFWLSFTIPHYLSLSFGYLSLIWLTWLTRFLLFSLICLSWVT